MNHAKQNDEEKSINLVIAPSIFAYLAQTIVYLLLLCWCKINLSNLVTSLMFCCLV